ncbi:NAD(P)/FAD-dependent oxidoreductase [bacterium]|nr:NAD(P)/FAD-dependent oxidoreductase [bacterium]
MKKPDKDPATHFTAAVIGGGPAGIGVSVGLARRGIKSVVLIERRKELGGIPALYKKKPGGAPTFIRWTQGRVVFGEELAGVLRRKISRIDVKILRESNVFEIKPEEKKLHLVSPATGAISITADAIIMACGSREMTPVERGWLLGARSARVFFTRHLLDLMETHNCLPIQRPIIVGSDLIAYAAAAKLRAAGASQPILIDQSERAKCKFPERYYFQKLRKFDFRGCVQFAEIIGTTTPTAVKLSSGELIPCDGIVLGGELIPNSELALNSSLDVALPSRKLKYGSDHQLSQSGWFAAGNVLGGFHGAEWCYFNGLRVAKSVAKYLSKLHRK